MVALLESVWAAASLGGGELKGVPSIKQADRIGINSCCSGGCYFDGLPSCFAAWVREASRCGHVPVPEPCGHLPPRHLRRAVQGHLRLKDIAVPDLAAAYERNHALKEECTEMKKQLYKRQTRCEHRGSNARYWLPLPRDLTCARLTSQTA